MASCPTETGEMATNLNWKKFNGKKFHHKKFLLNASNNENFLQQIILRKYFQQQIFPKLR